MIESIKYEGKSIDRTTILKEYYAKYLKEVRGLSDASVNHYFDALNHISRRLKAMDLVQQDIYEIADLDRLYLAREALYADINFMAVNERGKRMYSAGMNNYCRFQVEKDLILFIWILQLLTSLYLQKLR